MGAYNKWQSFQPLSKQLVTMVMQLVDLTQTTLSGLKLSCVRQKLSSVLIQTSMGAAKYIGGYKVCKALLKTL